MLTDPALGSLCDVVLVVQGERFPAHRAVLAAASNVFKAMFTNSMKEQRQHEIVLNSLDSRAWRMAMQYIYNAQLELHDEHTALLLLATARMYQLERLVAFVENFLVACVRVTNAFQLLVEAERYNLSSLEDACYKAMEQDFEALALSPAFLQCPKRVLTKLISSGGLVVKSEMFVFEMIIRWLTASDDEARLSELDDLLELVRTEKMSDAHLRVAACHKLVQRTKRFKEKSVEQLLSRADDVTETIMASGCHLKPRRRDSAVFTFYHVQHGMTRQTPADEEEVVRTPWATDGEEQYMWRLKIYPRGYNKAKGQYLSMYVQGRSASKKEKLNVKAKFDIFLVNRSDQTMTVSFSSEHHFTETSDHWGFHRFLQLSQLQSATGGFLDENSDSVILGANVYFISPSD